MDRSRGECTESRPKRILRLFPQEIQDFADQFIRMQRERHRADYDPLEQFSRSTGLPVLIEETKTAIADFEQVDTSGRRAFPVFVLFDLRRD